MRRGVTCAQGVVLAPLAVVCATLAVWLAVPGGALVGPLVLAAGMALVAGLPVLVLPRGLALAAMAGLLLAGARLHWYLFL